MAAPATSGEKIIQWQIRKIVNPDEPIPDIANRVNNVLVLAPAGQNTLRALADSMKHFCSDFNKPNEIPPDIVDPKYNKYILIVSGFANGKKCWEIAAFMLTEEPADKTYHVDLHHLCTADHFRGYGYAKQLLSVYEWESRQFSTALPYIIIEVINTPIARDFYKRNGYNFTLYDQEHSDTSKRPAEIVYMIKFFPKPNEQGIIGRSQMASDAPLRQGYIAKDGELIETTL